MTTIVNLYAGKKILTQSVTRIQEKVYRYPTQTEKLTCMKLKASRDDRKIRQLTKLSQPSNVIFISISTIYRKVLEKFPKDCTIIFSFSPIFGFCDGQFWLKIVHFFLPVMSPRQGYNTLPRSHADSPLRSGNNFQRKDPGNGPQSIPTTGTANSSASTTPTATPNVLRYPFSFKLILENLISEKKFVHQAELFWKSSVKFFCDWASKCAQEYKDLAISCEKKDTHSNVIVSLNQKLHLKVCCTSNVIIFWTSEWLDSGLLPNLAPIIWPYREHYMETT